MRGGERYVVVVEHDLALLDCLSDAVCVFYGERGAFGVASAPLGSRDGVNAFLAGHLPSENVTFRRSGSLDFGPVGCAKGGPADGQGGGADRSAAQGADGGARGCAETEDWEETEGWGAAEDCAHDIASEWSYPSVTRSVGDFSLRVATRRSKVSHVSFVAVRL